MLARSCLPPFPFTRRTDVGLNHLVHAVASNCSTQARMTSSGPPPVAPPKPGSFSDRYDKFIARWPKVHALHRMVVDGSRWCFSDIKVYYRIKRDLSSKKRKITDLTMEELEVLIQQKYSYTSVMEWKSRCLFSNYLDLYSVENANVSILPVSVGIAIFYMNIQPSSFLQHAPDILRFLEGGRRRSSSEKKVQKL
ncbi:hypothetical protein Y032_0501g2600 [Ancylostoma ceylanicum]|uniref:Uncharacterized protein n=1 Tax=Ancylostoma ceylanicum TaxID=53326 RepID=A0A016WV86_9BILA|nr:hypothetical protein Y032_0501g2600 [Ancylostoma ceylanicum]